MYMHYSGEKGIYPKLVDISPINEHEWCAPVSVFGTLKIPRAGTEMARIKKKKVD